MITVENLNYKYNSKFALDDINFTLEDGYIMALLGKNGAGKTTLLNAMYGVTMVNSGRVVWDNDTVVEKQKPKRYVKKQEKYHFDVAYVGDFGWCFEKLTVDENLELLSLLYENFDMDLFEKIMRVFEFPANDRRKNYESLSTGQRMQFQIAFNLARHPRLLLMDEPLSNLDPVVKMDILELIRNQVAADKMSIIMSTHLVEEITDMADYIGIIEEGTLTVFGDRESVFDERGVNSIRELLKTEEE